jgi:hypothetical protein
MYSMLIHVAHLYICSKHSLELSDSEIDEKSIHCKQYEM